jgi:hypothetical protein
MVGDNARSNITKTSKLQRDLDKLATAIQITPTPTSSTRSERIMTRNIRIEHADTIKDLLAERLRIATALFPAKTPPIRFAKRIKRRYWS